MVEVSFPEVEEASPLVVEARSLAVVEAVPWAEVASPSVEAADPWEGEATLLVEEASSLEAGAACPSEDQGAGP